MTADILKLHQGIPADDIAPTLRRIADELEAGEYGLVTTAILCFGHSSEQKDADFVDSVEDNTVFAMGPRTNIYTVRGLLVSVMKAI